MEEVGGRPAVALAAVQTARGPLRVGSCGWLQRVVADRPAFFHGLASCLRGWHAQQMTMLILARDEHFAWLLGEAPPPEPLREAPGGVEQRRILRWLRAVSARLGAAGLLGSWLIVEEDEVVGLCGFKGPPDGAGSAEIGYGIAATRRRYGHATEAVRLLCEEVGRSGGVTALRAETAINNPPSQRVLEHNGFLQVGARHDPEDGDLILWSRPLVAAGEDPGSPGADVANRR